MDPKSAQILDPKLKEAYDRVMGAQVAKPVTPPPAAPPSTAAHPPQPEAPKTPSHEPLDPMMAHAANAPIPPAPAAHTPAQPASAHPAATPAAPGHGAHAASMSFSSGYVAPHPEKKAPISGPLLFVAGIVFLCVYTLFWMKWFGMTVPFLP